MPDENLQASPLQRENEALRRQLVEARAESLSQTRFLAAMGHELRNPLAPIRNSVALMKGIGSSDPIIQRAQEIIDRQVTHLTRLVDDLLDVSRISDGRITLGNAELHGGMVSARSEGSGRGSEFTLRLPLQKAGPAPSPRVPAAEQASWMATKWRGPSAGPPSPRMPT
jgi:signal transduction histidine kinase